MIQLNNHIPGKLKVARRTTFLESAQGRDRPREKRKIIETLIEVFDREVKKLGQVDFGPRNPLPRRIESVPIEATLRLIKSHHNVGGLPKRMKLTSSRCGNSSRNFWAKRGLPKEYLRAILSCPVSKSEKSTETPGVLRKRTPSLVRVGVVPCLASLCVFLPVRSVGVMGDERTYKTDLLRAVTSSDAMTVDWA